MTHPDHDQFVAQAVEHLARDLDPVLLRWFASEQLTANLHSSLANDLVRAVDTELAAGFAGGCPVDGAVPADYMNRFAPYSGGTALFGIRFKGLDITKPFVDVVATSAPITNESQVEELCRLARHTYVVFSPKAVPFVVTSTSTKAVLSRTGSWEKKYLVGSLAEMKALPQPNNLGRVELRPSTDLGFFDRYVLAYRELLEATPKHGEYATSQDLEEFEFYLKEGAVFEVFIDRQWAGVFAGHRHVEACLDGLLVTENLLTAEFRSRGFGRAVQWRLAHQLGPEYRMLFGTIHQENFGAYHAALRSGRVDIGGFCWVFF